MATDRLILVLLTCLLWAGVATAQTVGQQLPPGMDAGRAIEDMQLPSGQPRRLPAPKLTLPEVQIPQDRSAKDEDLHFILGSVTLDGNTLLTDQDLDLVVQPLLGTPMSVSGLSQLAQALTALYRSKGYVLARAELPPQRIERDGHVRLLAVEAEIESVQIRGGDPNGEPLIRSYLQSLLHNRSVELERIENSLLLARDLEGVAISAELAEGSSPGTVVLIVSVERAATSWQIYYDNMNSPYQGLDRFIAMGQFNNLYGRSDYLRLTAQRAFHTSESTSWSILQGLMVGEYGERVELSYSDSVTHPGGKLKPFNLEGTASIGSIIYYLPVQRSRYFTVRTQLGLVALNSQQTALGASESLYHDRINMMTVGGGVDWQDSVLGGGLSALSLNADVGLSPNPEHPSRYKARGQFVALKYFLNRFQTITDKLSLQLALGGQFADYPLVSSEQYGLGAYPFGRGFDISTIAGDQAAAGKIELRYDLTEFFRRVTSPLVSAMSVFAFHDAGRVWSFYADSASLASSGIGLRGTLDAHPLRNIDKSSLNFDLFVAWKQYAPAYVNQNSPVVRARVILNF